MTRTALVLLVLSLGACATARPAGSAATPPVFRPAPLDAQSAQRAAAKYARAQELLASAGGQAALGEAATLLEEACDEGNTTACAFIDANLTRPVKECSPELTRDDILPLIGTGAIVDTEVRCGVTPEGEPEDCRVVLDDPYGVSASLFRQVRACHWRPATLQGKPFATEASISITTFGPPDPEARVNEARRRLARFPSSGSAWRNLALTLAQTAPADPELASALKRALLAFPDDASLQAVAARMQLAQGRAQEALPYARSAVVKAPNDVAILETYAAVSAALGRCPDAVLAQRQALALAGDSLRYMDRARMEQRAEAYAKRCAASASP